MKLLGTDALCSYAQLKIRFGGNGAEGLRRVWDIVQGWVADPRKLRLVYGMVFGRFYSDT